MGKKKKKNKTFYGVNVGAGGKKVYLVYRLVGNSNKLVADSPFDSLLEANLAMEGYLSSGLCSWIATYNE